MNLIARWRQLTAWLLRHSRNQKRPQNAAVESTGEAEYDERQSMLPLVLEKQYQKSLSANSSRDQKNNETHPQAELVKWTKILAIVTGCLAVATFVVAFFAAWGSIDTAHLAAAARDQANTAADIEQRQLRAYAFVSAKQPILTIDKPIQGGAGVQIFGQTPAYKVHGWVGINIYPIVLPREIDLDNNDLDFANQNSTFLAPGKPFIMDVSTKWNLTKELNDIVAGGNYAVYTFGVANYEDVFGCEHFVSYCFRSDASFATPCQRHNETHTQSIECKQAK